MGGAVSSKVFKSKKESKKVSNKGKRKSNNEVNSNQIHRSESGHRVGVNSSCRVLSGTTRQAVKMNSSPILTPTNNNNENSAATPNSSINEKYDKGELVVLTQKLINEYLERYQIAHRGVARKDTRIQKWINEVSLEVDESNNPIDEHLLLMKKIEVELANSPHSKS